MCGGVLWFPPQKVVSLKKGRGKKRKKKEERRKQKTTNLERKGRGEKVTEKTANFTRGETKFASCDVPQNDKEP